MRLFGPNKRLIKDFAVVLKAVLEAVLEALEVDLGQVPKAVCEYLV